MKARMLGGRLILLAETPNEEHGLKGVAKRGHVHFVCKGMMVSRGRTQLVLAPSIVNWRRHGMLPASGYKLASDAVCLLASTVVTEPLWTPRQKRLRRSILKRAPGVLAKVIRRA